MAKNVCSDSENFQNVQSDRPFQIEDLCQRLNHVLEHGQLPTVLYREFVSPQQLPKITEETPNSKQPQQRIETVNDGKQAMSPISIQIRVQRKKASFNVLADYSAEGWTADTSVAPPQPRKIVRKIESLENNSYKQIIPPGQLARRRPILPPLQMD